MLPRHLSYFTAYNKPTTNLYHDTDPSCHARMIELEAALHIDNFAAALDVAATADSTSMDEIHSLRQANADLTARIAAVQHEAGTRVDQLENQNCDLELEIKYLQDQHKHAINKEGLDRQGEVDLAHLTQASLEQDAITKKPKQRQHQHSPQVDHAFEIADNSLMQKVEPIQTVLGPHQSVETCLQALRISRGKFGQAMTRIVDEAERNALSTDQRSLNSLQRNGTQLDFPTNPELEIKQSINDKLDKLTKKYQGLKKRYDAQGRALKKLKNQGARPLSKTVPSKLKPSIPGKTNLINPDKSSKSEASCMKRGGYANPMLVNEDEDDEEEISLSQMKHVKDETMDIDTPFKLRPSIKKEKMAEKLSDNGVKAKSIPESIEIID